jgi:hypothetical protein
MPKINTIEILLPRKKLTRTILICCVVVEVVLFLLDAFVSYGGMSKIAAIRRLFSIVREDALGSWFSSAQTLMVGLTAWLLTLLSRYSGKRSTAWAWGLIAAFFTYMAVDDGAKVHERVGSVYEHIALSGSDEAATGHAAKLLDIFPSFSWQIIFMPIFCAMGLFILIFLIRELKQPKARIVIFTALALFAVTASLDFFEGVDKYEMKSSYNIHMIIRDKFDLENHTVQHFSKSIEEFLEMIATTLFWLVFVDQLLTYSQRGVRFSLPCQDHIPSAPYDDAD